MRSITYCDAIKEALHQEMDRDDSVFIYGIGVPDHKEIFGSVGGLRDRFGPMRCFDTPIAEDCMTGFGLGAALGGLRPIHVHIRVDFLMLAMNQLSNMVSSTRYISGGTLSAPFVIRAVIGRGWGQGCQHSKSVQSIFAHIPGLKVVMPTSPSDAKGMLIAAIRDDNPVIILEHRWLYWQMGEVEHASYTTPLNESKMIREGSDITIIATSWMVIESIKAASLLEKYHGLSCEIIDARSISPLDDSVMVESVNKTHHCMVADNDWLYCGFSAEICTTIAYKCFTSLHKPPERIGFAFCPCPTARHLENHFYSNAKTIVRKVERMFNLQWTDLSDEEFFSHENRFKGPF